MANAMKWVSDFESSNIVRFGYDAETRTLHVGFKGGSEYKYENVPEDVYREFLASGSKGAFFHTNIKKSYEFKAL